MDAASLRSSPPVAKAKGQLRAGLRYAWSVDDVRVPLLLMAVVGTLAFNYQVLLPLLAERELGRHRHHLHDPHDGASASARWSGRCGWPGASRWTPASSASRRSCSGSARVGLAAVARTCLLACAALARRRATPASACCRAATPCSSWPPARRCGAGCSPSTASCSWARRRSAARSSGKVADAFGTPAGIAIGAVASLAAGVAVLLFVRRRGAIAGEQAVPGSAVLQAVEA